MAKSKLRTTFTKARLFTLCRDLSFLPSPWEVKGAPDNSHCPSDKVKTVIEPAWQVLLCTVPLRPGFAHRRLCQESTVAYGMSLAVILHGKTAAFHFHWWDAPWYIDFSTWIFPFYAPIYFYSSTAHLKRRIVVLIHDISPNNLHPDVMCLLIKGFYMA